MSEDSPFAPPAARTEPLQAPPRRSRLVGCLVWVGGGVLVLLGAAIAMIAIGGSDASEKKPQAVAFAARVHGCLADEDEQCLAEISDLSEEKVAQTVDVAATVHGVMGDRLGQQVLDDSWSWRKAMGSNPGLHMRFAIRATYENGEVTETFAVVHRDEGFRFQALNFASDALLEGLTQGARQGTNDDSNEPDAAEAEPAP